MKKMRYGRWNTVPKEPLLRRKGPLNLMYRRIDKTSKSRNRDMKMNIVDQTEDLRKQDSNLRNLDMITNIVKQGRMRMKKK